MKHSNISIFIPHVGCPHTCAFCNQRTISGKSVPPTPDDVRKICTLALKSVPDRQNSEIAFFGGSFTAIDKDYMTSLLQAASDFVGENGFYGIRCSTRPDAISEEILDILKRYHVSAIELGAQSMSDKVLLANERGHTAKDVIDACKLIKDYEFELGLQMMVGLFNSTVEDEYDTAEKIIAVAPKTVRIYPTVILQGTKLAELYKNGSYKTFSFDETLRISADIMERFISNKIKVIKCGLHASEFVERDMVGGFYHPAFRELCEGLIYRNKIESLILAEQDKNSEYVICVNPSCVSKAIGQNKSNIIYFKNKGIDIKIKASDDISAFECLIKR